MKNIAVVLILIMLATACSKPKTTYRLKAKSREYLAFFGKGTWWQYSNNSGTDSFKWTAWSAILATMQSNPQYEVFSNFSSPVDEHMNYDCEYGISAGLDTDGGGISGNRMYFEVTATDNSISGSGNLPLEQNVVAGSRTYNSVLHLHSSDTLNYHIYSDIWIAPNIGIIKLLRRDDTNVYYLKDYVLTRVNNDM